jgi:hypothetical protein
MWAFSKRDWFALVASVVTIIGLPFAIYGLWDLNDQRTLRGLQIAMYADQQLNSGSSVKVRHAIHSRRPVLDTNGGASTKEELFDYLNIFEGLGDAYDLDQIDRETIFLWHSYPIARAFENEEVKKLIAEERKGDPDLYTGFEALAKEMIADETKARPKPKRQPEIKRP